MIVKELVADKDAVKVTRKVDERGVLLTLQVAQNDMGRVIGTAGNNAKAIRTLVTAWGMAHDQRIYVKITDPPGVEFIKSSG